MKLVSLDPGATTGYAIYDSGYVTYGHIGPEEHHFVLYQFLQESALSLHTYQHPRTDMIIICERFDHVSGVAKLISNEYIGVIKCWCQTYSVPLVMQGRSIKPGQLKKGWASDEKLAACGLLVKPKSRWPHANDALRHLMYFGYHDKRSPAGFRQAISSHLREAITGIESICDRPVLQEGKS